MANREDRESVAARGTAANDNGGAEACIEAVVMTPARLLGCRIARKELRYQDAANDNAPAGEAGDV